VVDRMLKPSYELNSCGTIYHPTETQWVKNVNLSSSDSAFFFLSFSHGVEWIWSGCVALARYNSGELLGC